MPDMCLTLREWLRRGLGAFPDPKCYRNPEAEPTRVDGNLENKTACAAPENVWDA